jgi:hypothetical protein
MDPFGRWSQQRLLEEVATNEARGDKPAGRGGRSVATAVLVTVIFVIAAIVVLATNDADQPSPAPDSGAGVGQSIEVDDVVE